MSCAPGCRTCGPASTTCAASSAPSTPRPPTGTPTSNSPTTSTASSPGCAAAPPPPASASGSGCCSCSPRTSSSDPRRSPSATASRSGNGPPAAAATKATPTRRVTCARVIHCVGGVISPVLLNVALHGLEEAAGVRYRGGDYADHARDDSPVVVRYADDFVACCFTEQQAVSVRERLKGWLAERGLSLNQ